MSCNYADGLSPYRNKGKLGLKEKFDSKEEVGTKVVQLAEWISTSKHIVIHTGAGISTSAGIPDFRGPKGVWTLEKKGLKPEINISFNDAVPTKTHMAIAKLVECGKVQYVVSQNIDGLHLRSGLPRDQIAELHGNMFTERCNQCERQYIRGSATTTVGQKCLEMPCPSLRRNGRPCRGRLHDTILDWEHNLPENDLGMADFHSCIADLSICLGTTLQIVPSGNLPIYSKKFGGRLVICNLQPTKHDRKADLLIHSFVDDIMVQLMKLLDLSIPEYTNERDPVKTVAGGLKVCIDWTIPDSKVKAMRTVYEEKCCKQSKKRASRIDEDRKDNLSFKNVKRRKSKEDDSNSSSSISSRESLDIVKTELNTDSSEILDKSSNTVRVKLVKKEYGTENSPDSVKTENEIHSAFKVPEQPVAPSVDAEADGENSLPSQVVSNSCVDSSQSLPSSERECIQSLQISPLSENNGTLSPQTSSVDENIDAESPHMLSMMDNVSANLSVGNERVFKSSITLDAIKT